MNLKTINSPDPLIRSQLGFISFHSNLEEHTLLSVAHSILQLQATLLKNSISYAQSVSGGLILKTTLKNTVETLTKYTEADEGSIFLIDEDGVIIESILARGPVTRDRKDAVISKVLDGGLAGATMMQYSMESIAAIILNAQLHAEYRPLDL